MADHIISNFGGLDLRRLEEASPKGVLSKAINGHLNSGGEFEKRRAFVSTYVFTGAAIGATFGLAEMNNVLYVFGSTAGGTVAAGIPVGVTYVQLAHPSGQAMTAVNWVEQFNAKLYVIATYADGSRYHFFDGTRITDWFDGKARGSFDITGGTFSSPAVNGLTSVQINGVEAMNVTVNWTTDHATTAAAVAAQVNAYASTPEYAATSIGATVFLIAGSAGTASNGYLVAATPKGNVTVGNVVNLAGGQDGSPGDPGATARTLKDKMYTTSGNNLYFSALRDCTKYNINDLGAGYIQVATHSSGSQQLNTTGIILANLAAFAQNAIQIWFVDADDANNSHLQTIGNIGTTAPRSVAAAGDSSLFFLAVSGIRSLKPMPLANSVFVSAIGAPLENSDPAISASIQNWIGTLSTTVRDQAVAILEPREGRFLMALGSRVYVYTNFPETGVTGWSWWEPGFQITDWATMREKLYARSGDTIYLYGGPSFTSYDSSVATMRIPYLSAGVPSQFQNFQSFDVALTGEWTVTVSPDPTNPTQLETIVTTDTSTNTGLTIPMAGSSPDVALEIFTTKSTAARVAQVVLHYDVGPD